MSIANYDKSHVVCRLLSNTISLEICDFKFLEGLRQFNIDELIPSVSGFHVVYLRRDYRDFNSWLSC